METRVEGEARRKTCSDNVEEDRRTYGKIRGWEGDKWQREEQSRRNWSIKLKTS